MLGQLAPRPRIGLAVTAGIAGVAGIGLALPSEPVPTLALLTPIVYFVATLGDLGAAVLLLAMWRTSDARRSTFALALTFAVSGVLIFLAMLTLQLLPAEPPVFGSPPQAAIWVLMLWHLFVGAGILIYIALRRSDSAAVPSRPFVAGALAAAIGALAAIVAFAYVLGPHLALANGATVAGHLSAGIGPASVLVLALASVLVFRVSRPTPIDRALAYSSLALTISITLFVISAHRYTPAFYAGRVLLFFAEIFVFVAAVHTLVWSRARLAVTENALSRVTGETARQASRIRAVWEIASASDLSDDERYSSILQIATSAMRPEMPMFGSLSHIEGEALVFDATSWTGADAQSHALSEGVYPGASVPFEKTIQSLLGSNGRTTLAWNDLGFLDGRGMMHEKLALRSFVGTPVLIGRQTYFLTFSSTLTTVSEPFAEDDIAFVDVVAAFFAHRFTQQRQFEQLQFQIEHDALTGLVNRVQFRKAVREEIRAGTPFTVAFVDLDGFRHVNESEGNQIGDEVLVEIASTLDDVSKTDLVARMSADEFGILVRGVAGVAGAGGALNAYAEIFQSRFHTGDRGGTQMLGIGASIGAASYPFDGNSAEALMRRADVALGVAKSSGGSATSIFDGNMEAILAESHLRVVELADAIAQDQLAMVYQPTFELATRRVTGAEALVRWDHPERGRLMPSEFISFAEKNGMIAALSRWVFRRTVRDISSVVALPPRFRVYFNLAAEMLDDIPFIAEVRAALDVDPRLVERLGIEVTETAAMQNVERSMHTIDMFRQWGLAVAIDDFGTGYSSLSYLKQLTVDVIKIDRSFVMGLPGGERDGAITEMLLRITDRFGFATLAEGIETEEQAAWLLEHGCRYGQGYLVAKPFSFDDLLECVAGYAA